MTSRFAATLRGGVAACALFTLAVTGLPAGEARAVEMNEITCSGTGPCREAQTMLPLRALPRPAANIYDAKAAEPGAILVENVAPFSPLFVFGREAVDLSDPANPKGWYQVGRTAEAAEGWMQARDVMEWRQALVVSYTHPGTGEEARQPVLMFEDRETLRSLIESDDREAQAQALYADIATGGNPAGVVSVEPRRFVDIEDTFYVLPVLDYAEVDLFDEETRLLQIAAAVPNQRSDAETQTTLENKAFVEKSTKGATAEELVNLRADIVFVMDLTGSMGKHVEATKEAIKRLATSITDVPKLKERVRFGFVGYRDDLSVSPQLEFVSRNFTPELVDDAGFLKLVEEQVKASEISSDDYAEEVYAGIKTALETNWSENALRFIVQVGDASAHEPRHPQNTTGLGAAELRQMANDANVSMFSMHLREARAASDHPKAEMQFSRLTENPGVTRLGVLPIDAADPASYDTQVATLASRLSESIRETLEKAEARARAAAADRTAASAAATPSEANSQGGGAATALAATQAGPSADDGELKDLPVELAPQEAARSGGTSGGLAGLTEELKDLPSAESDGPMTPRMKAMLGEEADDPNVIATAELAKEVADAALVNYLGGDPVRDITFWAMDHDLVDPDKRAMDVRVLVTKEELNNLIVAMRQVTEAMQTADMTGLEFFASLQAVMAQVAKGQQIDFNNAQRLGSTNLLPRWIESLPYRSAILEMNNAVFEAMVPEERVRLEEELTAKLNYYVEVNNNTDVWQALNDQAGEAARVYPLPLTALP